VPRSGPFSLACGATLRAWVAGRAEGRRARARLKILVSLRGGSTGSGIGIGRGEGGIDGEE